MFQLHMYILDGSIWVSNESGDIQVKSFNKIWISDEHIECVNEHQYSGKVEKDGWHYMVCHESWQIYKQITDRKLKFYCTCVNN